MALPGDPYPPDVFDTKVQAVYNDVLASYRDDGSSVYTTAAPAAGAAHVDGAWSVAASLDIDTITDAVITRLRTDSTFASRVADELSADGDR